MSIERRCRSSSGPRCFLHDRQLDHFGRARASARSRNQLRHQSGSGRGFDHQRQLHGGLGKAHGLLRRGELRAVDDVAPVDQIGERPGIESEFLRRDRGQKFRAGFVGGIVELFAGMILPEMLGVLGLQKRALVMVEPPGEQRRAGILEIDDGVFVAVEQCRPSKGCEALCVIPRVKKFRVRDRCARGKSAKKSRRRKLRRNICRGSKPEPSIPSPAARIRRELSV